MLAGVIRVVVVGRAEVGVRRSRVRLMDVNTRKSPGFNYKLVCYFKLGVASGSLFMTSMEQHS